MLSEGPYDSREYPDRAHLADVGLVDAGALWLPIIENASMHFSIDKPSRRVFGVVYVIDGSAIQLQVFAAPRSRGIWESVCLDMRTAIAAQRGTSTHSEGEFGSELLVNMPLPQGGKAVSRVFGIDGSRWMLKASISGPAALDEQKAQVLIDVCRKVVVDRGSDPYPPKELLPLRLPQTNISASASPSEAQSSSSSL